MEARISKQNRITIPKQFSDQLGLKPGDRMQFIIQPNSRGVAFFKVASAPAKEKTKAAD